MNCRPWLWQSCILLVSLCLLVEVYVVDKELNVKQAPRRSLLHSNNESGKGLRLRLVSRNSIHSPIKKGYGSHAEELSELFASDARRILSFNARMKALAMEVELAPSPTPCEQAPITSGSSFPGNIGLYFVELFLGTPEQRFLFILDTASDLIWAPCFPCNTCIHGSIFSPSLSSTFSAIACSSDECNLVPAPVGSACTATAAPCEYDYIYGDKSESRGIFAYETFTLGRVKLPNVAFGCGTRNSGTNFIASGAGVLGLGQGIISFSSQIGFTYGNVFSYCLPDFFAPAANHSFLIFGTAHWPALRLSYTPLLKNPLSETYYYVGIERIQVAGLDLWLPESVWNIDIATGNGGVVIDSGSTLTSFRQPAYDIILAAFRNSIPYARVPAMASLDLCYRVPTGKLQLPQFRIVFKGGAVFSPPAGNYFLRPTAGVRCLGFISNPSPAGPSIIGNLIQQNFWVEYDRAHNRLGFTPKDCLAQP